jgi:hypothetical protein
MPTPAASGTLYATVTDLRDILAGTDSGTGTPAQLTDAQLTLALYRASNTVSVYAGNVYDGSTAQAAPPPILHDLSLDIAAFWAWRTYLKGKSIPADHPSFIAYQNAMNMLEEVRKGAILLDPAPAPGIGDEVGTIINRIPAIFTGEDSNTRVSPRTGVLEADTPIGGWTPRGTDWNDGPFWGPVYQG